MPRLSRRRFAALAASGIVGLAHARTRAFHQAAGQTGLKDVFKDDFLIGTAVDGRTVDDPATPLAQLVAREFNAITPTNMMKWGPLEPREGDWQWAGPDRLVAFGASRGMTVVGHTLVWHSQTPRWLFVDEQNAPVSKDRLLKRIDTHIQTLVGRYQGRVAIWDVVNEAIDEDEKGWRQSPFLSIAGPEFVERAFRVAHEADPKATLLYNDYNEHNPGRRRFLVDVIADYKRRGVPIHGVGFQGHVGLDYPDLAEYEKSLQAIAATGLPVHITELDVDVLPRASGYTGAEISTNFALSESLNPWKNNFPVRGRTNYPLLFDRELKPKGAVGAIAGLKSR